MYFRNLQLKFSAISPNKTVYVTDDRENFNCYGSGDQIEINGDLAYVAEKPQFTTAHLKGPNTYVISDIILIGNDTFLEGDHATIIKLEDQANWQRNKPLITQMDSAGNHKTIKGFEINGNHNKNEEKREEKDITVRSTSLIPATFRFTLCTCTTDTEMD